MANDDPVNAESKNPDEVEGWEDLEQINQSALGVAQAGRATINETHQQLGPPPLLRRSAQPTDEQLRAIIQEELAQAERRILTQVQAMLDQLRGDLW